MSVVSAGDLTRRLPNVTMTTGDLDLLAKPATNGKDTFWPTGALYGLWRISGDVPGKSTGFDTFYIISGISRIESPDEARKATLLAALDTLTTLKDPLAVVVVKGDVHSQTYKLTEKGKLVAEAIESAAFRESASGNLGYGDGSLTLLRKVVTLQA